VLDHTAGRAAVGGLLRLLVQNVVRIGELLLISNNNSSLVADAWVGSPVVSVNRVCVSVRILKEQVGLYQLTPMDRATPHHAHP